MRRGLPLLCLLLLTPAPLFANTPIQKCGDPGNSTAANPVTISTVYDPARTTAINVTMTFHAPPGVGPCNGWVGFTPASSDQMVGPGGAKLNYSFTGDWGIADWNWTGAQTASDGTVQDMTGTFIIGAGQRVPAGIYTQQKIINVAPTPFNPYMQTVMTLTATIASGCTLPAPSISSLDFSPGILNGRPTPGYRQTTSIQGATCTGPATLTLRGAPLRTAASGASFANTINYTATATFGTATTTLSTASSAQASATAPAGNGPVSIGVSLSDDSKPLMAGVYSSTLSVVLEPAN